MARTRVGRKITWNMGKKYAQGWEQGVAEQLAEDERRFHVRITYPEILRLVQDHGRIALRKNTYPIVMLSLFMLSDNFYYIKAIGKKHMWSRFQQWAKGTIIQIVWEGENAQSLIRKLIRYMNEETEMKMKALHALRWLPRRGGAPEPEIDLSDISQW